MLKRMIKTAFYLAAFLTPENAFGIHLLQSNTTEVNNKTKFPGCLNMDSDTWCFNEWAPDNGLEPYLNETELLACYKSQQSILATLPIF